MQSKKHFMGDLVETDLQGYEEALEDPSCETELFDLNGKKVE